MARNELSAVPPSEAVKLLQEYLPILSHDVRTPMTAIKGAAGVLAEGFAGPLTEQQLRLVSICRRNADLATLLVQDVVELIRLQTGLAQTNATRFDMVSEAREVWSDSASHTNLPVAIESASDELFFRADRYFFRRCIGALIRFPQPYPEVKRASLALDATRGGAELALSFGPISREKAEIDRMLTVIVRGRRWTEGRLQTTGLEMAFLNALSCRFAVKLTAETHSDDRLEVRLFWPEA